VNKSDMIEAVAEATGMSKKVSGEAVAALFGAAGEALRRGEEVRIPDFGVLKLKHRAAREGRNPQTGAKTQFAAKTSVGFRPAKALVDSLPAPADAAGGKTPAKKAA